MTKHLNKKTNIYQHYQTIIDQTILMQHMTASLASSLKTSIMLLPNPKLTAQPLSPQMKQIGDKIKNMITRIRDSIENQVRTIGEVNQQLSKMVCDFRKFIDLARNEEERSSFTLAQLYNQLKFKEADIRDCQSAVEKQAFKKHELEWKQQHYLSPQKQTNQSYHQTYLLLLKEFTKKIETQIRFQKREMDRIIEKTNKIMVQMKTKLISIWHRLFEKDISQKSTKKCGISTNPEDRYAQLQHAYVKKERAIDEFDMSKFQGIKKRLKLLEQAEMSESREYRSYSASGEKDEVVEESEIAELLQM